MAGRSVLIAGIVAASAQVSGAFPTMAYQSFPNIADTTHASDMAVKFFHQLFTAKSLASRDVVNQYNSNHTGYFDATLGVALAHNYSELEVALPTLAARWSKEAPNDRAYPVRIVGDTTHGAIVHMSNTPGLFGAEIRPLTVFDFLDGTVSRQCDYWDGRGNPVKNSTSVGGGQDLTLGLPGLPENAAPEMKQLTTKLNNALSSGDANATAALFSYDGVFEDYTLRSRIEGNIGIASYLRMTIKQLPYGTGTKVAHVIGSAVGGGYEWKPDNKNNEVTYGITLLEVDDSGLITRFTTVWDGSAMSLSEIQDLAKAAPLVSVAM